MSAHAVLPILALPPEARRDFAAPRGPVCSGGGCLDLVLGRVEAAACVGDVVTGHCLDALERLARTPSLVVAVFDGKTRRSVEIEPLAGRARGLGFQLYETVNPPGGVSPGAALLLCRLSRQRGRHAVAVSGEEDMLALPLIQCIPEGGLVAYGVPGRGVALVSLTRERKIDAWLRQLRLRPGRVLA